jgi:multicomponent Na+:H+ antiporter subunit D
MITAGVGMGAELAALPPGVLMILGALLLPVLPGVLRKAWFLLLPLLSLAQLLMLPHGELLSWTVYGYELLPVRIDGLSFIWALIFHIAAFISALYALHVKDTVQHVSGLMYAGSAVGAVVAGDLISLFVYWELTAITSVFLIWATRTERSYATGVRYLVIQVGSGVVLLAGVLLHFRDTGSLAFNHLGLGTPGTNLIFLAFGVKAAFPGLHMWLEDAYPEATPTGAVWLSAFTTKLAIYALARGFAGTGLLIPIGAAMTAFPIFFAVIENDLRRVLAYSLNNQLGYMVVGIGIGTELAINGAAAHAFAHILYKGLLFMSMGAVLHRVGTINGSDLGDLYKRMPWTTVFCIIGAASISAFPLTSGFVSKSLILSAAAEEHHTIAFMVLLFASAGVFHHSGIKIPFFAFFERKHSPGPWGPEVKEAPANMLAAMGIAAFFCIGLGVMGIWPETLYSLLPYDVPYTPYDTTHVVTQMQLLMFSALAFAVLKRTGTYPPELHSVNLDLDWVYRRFAATNLDGAFHWGGWLRGIAESRVANFGRQMFARIYHTHGPRGVMSRTWETGSVALWAAVLLSGYLFLYYV